MKKTVLSAAVIVFLVVVIAPFFSLLGDALFAKESFVGAFVRICCNQRALMLLVRSILIALGAALFALMLGVPVGFFIARTNIYLKRLARYLYLLPLLIPSYIAAISWVALLGNKGVFNVFLTRCCGFTQGIFTIYGPAGVIFVLGLSYFPFIALLTMSGLWAVDRRLEEAARLAADERQVFKSVTLPLITPFIVAGLLFVFVFSLSNYGVPALLRVNTYPIEIFVQFSAFYNHRAAVVSSLPLLLITFVLLIMSYRIMRGKSYVSLEGRRQKPHVIELRKKRALVSIWVWFIIFVSGILPVVTLVISAGSFNSYVRAFTTSIRPIVTSVTLAAVGAGACVFFGFFLSFIIERGDSKAKTVLDVLSILPLAVAPTVLGVGLIKLWNRPATGFIYSGFVIVVFGFIARFMPFAVRILTSNFKQINPNMEEAAYLSGVGFLKTVWRVLLPLMRPGLFAGWIICFIFCMGELSTTLMVVPAGFETLSGKIFTLMHYGVGKLTSALCVILIVVTIIPVVGAGLLCKKGYAQ